MTLHQQTRERPAPEPSDPLDPTARFPGAGSARDPSEGQCLGIQQVLARVGDKWTVLVVMRLGERPHRFGELKRSINGVSQRMLTLTVRALERDGLVRRTVTPSIPPRVDYELTELGRSLRAPVQQLGQWALDHLGAMQAARTAFDRAGQGSGQAEGLAAE